METLESLEHQQVQMVDEMDDEVEEEQENREVKRSGSRPRIPKLMAKTISIRENQGGVTYKDLFGEYLRTAKGNQCDRPFHSSAISDR